MVRGIMELAIHPETEAPLDAAMRRDLAAAQFALSTVTPILHHLVGRASNALFGDEVIAGVRGMADDLARQLRSAMCRVSGEEPRVPVEAEDEQDDLALALTDNQALLGHLHALALEWQLARRLQARLARDPVLTLLLQDLIGSPDEEVADTAMQFLAAQARYCQAQRRMDLPLSELPRDLFLGALATFRARLDDQDVAEKAESLLRAEFDAATSRLRLAARLIEGLGGEAGAALSVTNAGSALFLTALALGSHMDRDLAALSSTDNQVPRLALALRASGLRQNQLEDVFLALHPDVDLPDGFDAISADRAAAILASAGN